MGPVAWEEMPPSLATRRQVAKAQDCTSDRHAILKANKSQLRTGFRVRGTTEEMKLFSSKRRDRSSIFRNSHVAMLNTKSIQKVMCTEGDFKTSQHPRKTTNYTVVLIKYLLDVMRSLNG